ncbi:MAG: hypothetical protein HY046_02485 [Acidobacteria bacterium]|nr:hypothetical protein [Acidobacteriota bacterium]
MRRWVIFAIGIFVLTLPCRAQIGKAVTVLAGTPEDKALVAIDAATDSKEKIALLDKFMAEFGTTDMVLQAYERYIAVYAADKNYDKAFEIGNKALAYDPENLQIAASLVRAAQEKADPARLGEWGARVSQIIQIFKAKPAPAGMNAEEWASRKNFMLSEAAGNLTFVEYAMFNTAMGLADPAQKAGLLARFVDAFPESAYASDAFILL